MTRVGPFPFDAEVTWVMPNGQALWKAHLKEHHAVEPPRQVEASDWNHIIIRRLGYGKIIEGEFTT